MMVGMVARGVDNDTHLSDDGTAPLTPPKRPREPGDDLDEEAQPLPPPRPLSSLLSPGTIPAPTGSVQAEDPMDGRRRRQER